MIQSDVASNDSAVADGTATLGATLLRVAWLAVGLGLVLEVILILLAIGFSSTLGMGKIVADLVQKISWSVIVCEVVLPSAPVVCTVCGFRSFAVS